MTIYAITKERQGLEQALLHHPLDFSGTYMTVSDLFDTIRKNPDDIREVTIQALEKVLQSGRHARQKKSLFLYRQVADCLAHIPVHSNQPLLSEQALAALQRIVLHGTDTRHRAGSEAIGHLPVLQTDTPEPLPPPSFSSPPRTDWRQIRLLGGVSEKAVPRRLGRSILLASGQDHLLTIKLARNRHDYPRLHAEAEWMVRLGHRKKQFQRRFDVPVPVSFRNRFLLQIDDIPGNLLPHPAIPSPVCGIAFRATPDYYAYPNGSRAGQLIAAPTFQKMMDQNAWLLGNLAASGIFHTAPIPLFHNRVQAHRRTDRGIYLWPMGGRLDRWLVSSQFPNVGASGIRDFEHLVPYSGAPRQLYEIIGTHILGLVLVIGSYFRNREPERVGLDPSGKPVDVRHVFDPALFSGFLRTIFRSYYEGFTASAFQGALPFCPDTVSGRLIDEMGVDRHMDEILRYQDVETMSDRRLHRFLQERNVFGMDAAAVRASREDIVLRTGPHLGGFNQRISVPELIPFLETVAAICILGKFMQTR